MSIPPDMRTGPRQYGLLPRRKLPQLPPKGERWHGLLRPSTLILLGVVILLVGGTWAGIALSRTAYPTTIDGVTAESSLGIDELEATLPVAPVAETEQSRIQPCPDGGEKQQVVLSRTLTLAASVSAADWAGDVSSTYRDKGWSVTQDTTDTGDTAFTLIGPALIPFVITLPAAGGSDVTIASDSRCAAG
ncbi:hypothetical protein [Herbiconiux solani]|uniref:hypothetical protein n=1 Tax=Herbiconiux solani TaxID=661329 RepID=UPI00082658D2|nr:hypothetical protein [Herbiconiux solani]